MTVHEFAICIDPETSAVEGMPCGRITVDDWQETFAVAPLTGHPTAERSLEGLWRDELKRLVDGAPVVVLPVQPGRGWILYRESDSVYVQEHLFMVHDASGELVLDATHFAVRARRTKSEDGDEISEWTTSVEAVRAFLK